MSTTGTGSKTVHDLQLQEVFMQRCFHLAKLASGYTAPNPMVGAVLVHKERIIGEGYHKIFGGPHAEINCLDSVKAEDRTLIPFSTLYVSLEPCSHHGKTPPCADRILREKIQHVVIGCRDPFPEVNGKGIEKLVDGGVRTEFPFMENQARDLNIRFFTFYEKKRPYIILKWAQSADRRMSAAEGKQMNISGELSNRLVHKWRSEEAGILIGTQTALNDNPELTTRLWPGKNPTRIVLDTKLRLPDTLNVFDGTVPTLVINQLTDLRAGNLLFKKIDAQQPVVHALLSVLHSAHILSVLIEGGPTLLQSFLDIGIWDEIRVITNEELELRDGIKSPEIKNAECIRTENMGSDKIRFYIPQAVI